MLCDLCYFCKVCYRFQRCSEIRIFWCYHQRPVCIMHNLYPVPLVRTCTLVISWIRWLQSNANMSFVSLSVSFDGTSGWPNTIPFSFILIIEIGPRQANAMETWNLSYENSIDFGARKKMFWENRQSWNPNPTYSYRSSRYCSLCEWPRLIFFMIHYRHPSLINPHELQSQYARTHNSTQQTHWQQRTPGSGHSGSLM